MICKLGGVCTNFVHGHIWGPLCRLMTTLVTSPFVGFVPTWDKGIVDTTFKQLHNPGNAC